MQNMLGAIEQIPEKQPGYHLMEFEQEFEKYWQSKQTGIKIKREPLKFDSTETESEDNSSDVSIELKKDKGSKKRRKNMTNRPVKQYMLTKEEALKQHTKGTLNVDQEKQ